MLPQPFDMMISEPVQFLRSVTRRAVSLLVAGLAIHVAAPAVRAQETGRVAADLSAVGRRNTAPAKPKARKRGATGARASTGPTWSEPRGVSALAADVGAALAKHTRGGQWGAIVVSLTHGDTLFAQNADGMMQPASTMKMYTAAAALDQFGPDYTFRTAALRDGQ